MVPIEQESDAVQRFYGQYVRLKCRKEQIMIDRCLSRGLEQRAEPVTEQVTPEE